MGSTAATSDAGSVKPRACAKQRKQRRVPFFSASSGAQPSHPADVFAFASLRQIRG